MHGVTEEDIKYLKRIDEFFNEYKYKSHTISTLKKPKNIVVNFLVMVIGLVFYLISLQIAGNHFYFSQISQILGAVCLVSVPLEIIKELVFQEDSLKNLAIIMVKIINEKITRTYDYGL